MVVSRCGLGRVFFLAVRQAVRRIREHHHDRHVRHHLGRVVQRAGRQPRRVAGFLAHRLLAQPDQRRDRTGAARSATAAAIRPSTLFARAACSRRSLRVAQHRGEHVGVERALIERDLADARHRGHDLRLDVDDADGADDVPPGPGLECRVAISRHASAVCAAARNASRRIGIGVDPECAAWPVNRSMWRSTPNVPSTTPVGLFIDSSTGPCSMCSSRYARASIAFSSRVRVEHPLDVDAVLGERIDEPHALPILQLADVVELQLARRRRGSEQAAPEARAFFVGPVDELQRHRRRRGRRACAAPRARRARRGSRRAIRRSAPSRDGCRR